MWSVVYKEKGLMTFYSLAFCCLEKDDTIIPYCTEIEINEL